MRSIVIIVLVAALTGCASMTPRQKAVVTAVGTVLVVGAIAAHGSKDCVNVPPDFIGPVKNPCPVRFKAH